MCSAAAGGIYVVWSTSQNGVCNGLQVETQQNNMQFMHFTDPDEADLFMHLDSSPLDSGNQNWKRGQQWTESVRPWTGLHYPSPSEVVAQSAVRGDPSQRRQDTGSSLLGVPSDLGDQLAREPGRAVDRAVHRVGWLCLRFFF